MGWPSFVAVPWPGVRFLPWFLPPFRDDKCCRWLLLEDPVIRLATCALQAAACGSARVAGVAMRVRQ